MAQEVSVFGPSQDSIDNVWRRTSVGQRYTAGESNYSVSGMNKHVWVEIYFAGADGLNCSQQVDRALVDSAALRQNLT